MYPTSAWSPSRHGTSAASTSTSTMTASGSNTNERPPSSTATPLAIRQLPSSKLSSGLKQLKDSYSSSPNSAINPKNLSHVPCKFYRQGTCQAGNACPFSHSMDVKVDQTPCKYFQKGNCKFGLKCANAHILPDGRRVNLTLPQQQQQQQQQQHQSRLMDHQYRHRMGEMLPSTPERYMTFDEPSHKPSSSYHHQPVASFGEHQFSHQPKLSRSMSSGMALWTDRNSNGGGSGPGSPFSRGGLQYQSHHHQQPSYLNGSAISDDDVDLHHFVNPGRSSDDDDGGDDEFGEDFVPSSLNELLTPQERQRRGSRSITTSSNNNNNMSTGGSAAAAAASSNFDIWGSPRTNGSYSNRYMVGSPQSVPVRNSTGGGLSYQHDSYFAQSPVAAAYPIQQTQQSQQPSLQQPIGTPDTKKRLDQGLMPQHHEHHRSHSHSHSISSQHQQHERGLGFGEELEFDKEHDDTQFFMEQEDDLDHQHLANGINKLHF